MTGYRCDSGNCIQVETDGATTTLSETTRPDIRVVTPTASWQALLQDVRDKERKRIVAALRGPGADMPWPVDTLGIVADMIERGEFGDLAAGDE